MAAMPNAKKLEKLMREQKEMVEDVEAEQEVYVNPTTGYDVLAWCIRSHCAGRWAVPKDLSRLDTTTGHTRGGAQTSDCCLRRETRVCSTLAV